MKMVAADAGTRRDEGGSAVKRCAWCQEISELVPVVNRDPNVSHVFDFICSVCAEVERYEHADEVIWNPLGFTPVRYRKLATSGHLVM
jgi:hypothetical protein